MKFRLLSFLSRKIGMNLDYFLKNSIWTGMGQIVSIVAGLILSIAFARLLNEQTFGQYQFFISILSIISIISLPGFSTSIFQSTARGCDGSYKKATKTSFIWSLLGIPILVIVGAYYYIYQHQILGLSLMLASVFFPLIYVPTIWKSFLQGKERFDLCNKYSSLQAIINTSVLITTIFLLRDNLLAIVVIYLISLSVFNTLWFVKSLKYIKNKKIDKEVISYGWFLTKMRIVSLIAAHADKVIIGIFLGPVELAIYVIGTNFAKKFFELIKSFFTIASPKISRANTVSIKLYSIVFIAASTMAVILYFSFPFLVALLFSDKYKDSIFLSQLVILFCPFFALNVLYKNHFLFYIRNKSIIFYESIAFPIIKILLMIPLLSYFNIKGLAFLIGFQHLLDICILYVLHKFLAKKR